MIENIKSQMRKGILEYCVLLILESHKVYPTEILEMLQKANLIVVEGTLYPLLTRLKNNDLVSYDWRESPQGPPRKYFYITDAGRGMLSELDKEWGAIARTIGRLFEIRDEKSENIPQTIDVERI